MGFQEILIPATPLKCLILSTLTEKDSEFVISTLDKNGILLAKNLTEVLVHSLSLQIYLFQCLPDFSFSTNYTDVEFSLIW